MDICQSNQVLLNSVRMAFFFQLNFIAPAERSTLVKAWNFYVPTLVCCRILSSPSKSICGWLLQKSLANLRCFLGERSEAFSHKDTSKWCRLFPVRDNHLRFKSLNLTFSAPNGRIYANFVWTLRRVHDLSYSKVLAVDYFFSASH